MANKKINSNGHEFVDLGLPSGTLWATMNVGASSPLDYGLYFQWGDTQGYTKEQVGNGEGQKKFASDWSDYKWYLSGSEKENNLKFIKYIKEGATLNLKDDAANVNMGGSWHMPSPEQIRELIDNTVSVLTKLDDVIGMRFISKNDPSKFIFIPAAGGAMDGSVLAIGYYGFAWSSMLSIILVGYGQSIYFNSESIYLSYNFFSRCNGLPVRGVIG